jgi:ligand-binding sensor domain-containing protein/signal transduction histidine kinase
MMRRQCVVVFLLLWCAIALDCLATVFKENDQYISQRWQTDDGLTYHALRGTAQSSEGYLWIATDGGLARFDGVRFVFALTSGLSNQPVTAIYQTKGSSVLLGTESGRIFQVIRDDVTPIPLPGSESDAITSVFESGDGSIWVGTGQKGVFRISKGNVTHLTTKTGLMNNSVRAVCEDHHGNIWIATASGLSKYENGQLTGFTVKEGLLNNSTRALFVDHKGDLWVGSHYGLSRFHQGAFQHFTKNDGLSDNIVTCISEDQEGQLWIGTMNGLTRRAGEKFIIETATDGGSFDRVYGIQEDRERNLWLSTRDGLVRLKHRILTTLTMQNGLSHHSVSSVCEDDMGAVWIGLWGGGINKISSNQVQRFSRNEGLSSDLVVTLLKTGGHELWAGLDYDGGLNRMSGERIIHYRQKEGLEDHSVRALLQDRNGSLWIGTRSALVSFSDGRFRRYTTSEGLPNSCIESLCEDSEGRIWCGTEGGLAVLDNGKLSAFTTQDGLVHGFVSSIFQDTEKNLWIGTFGGLLRYHDGRFTAFTTKAGLFHDEIHGLQEDNSERLWLSSARGVFCIKKKNLLAFEAGKEKRLSCTAFGKADGMLSAECKGTGSSALCKTRDGKLWIPTSRGVVVVDPQLEVFNSEPPRILIEEVLVEGHDILRNQTTELVADKQETVFRFTSPSFEAPEKMRFKYKLEGWDGDWIDASRREARYGRLPAGAYSFRVIGCNSDGQWNEEGTCFKLTFKPRFYQQAWFLSSMALLAAIGCVGTVRYLSLQKIRSKLRRTEQEHAVERERTRIAQDMHDELGARLTEVLILSQLVTKENAGAKQPHLTKMNAAVHDVIRNLDAIVWAVNPENDSLEKLVAYIHEYAQAYLETAGIRSWFEFPDQSPDLQLPSDLRHDFYSVVKESLNNAVKHSAATAVRLQLKCDETSVFLQIEDDGKGFVPANAAQAGNGLRNMQNRMQAVGGKLEIQSAPGTGTRISIQIPILNSKINRS